MNLLKDLMERQKLVSIKTLDNYRDKMLFDDDPSYWQILEELDTQK